MGESDLRRSNPKVEGSNTSPTTILVRPYCCFIIPPDQLYLSNSEVGQDNGKTVSLVT